MSFETKPRNSKLKISINKNGKLLPDNRLFSSVESINNLHNPIVLKDKIDFFITRLPGQTGLEDKDIPPGSVFFARIPLNYWLEMSRSAKDIHLSPGIKEVLRGWGYIQ